MVRRVRPVGSAGIAPDDTCALIGALRQDAGAWQACKDGAPSTWILKRGGLVGVVGGDIIDTEVACLALARAIDLTLIWAYVLDFGDTRAIAVSRYDRAAHPHVSEVAWAVVDQRTATAAARLPASARPARTRRRDPRPPTRAGVRRGPNRPRST